jgi:hypothetical protein
MNETRKVSIKSLGCGSPLLAVILISLSGCSSAARILDHGQGTRETEALELKQSVIENHDRSRIGPEKPWMFEGNEDETYFQSFSESYCQNERDPRKGRPQSVPRSVCAHRFMGLITSLLSRNYFAADPAEVRAKCEDEPLICGDLGTMEVMFRNLHNEGIEKSKLEKLSAIDDWVQKRLTDRELERALHMNFRFVDGRLMITLPGEKGKTTAMSESHESDAP